MLRPVVTALADCDTRRANEFMYTQVRLKPKQCLRIGTSFSA
ncbi:MAG: hypothetical protein J07HX5_01317 [halophilic archaeon J07HX5]|nr:MAG: hypothetical protein J07HX5_01317 [halophilic archaeon J07HX5]